MAVLLDEVDEDLSGWCNAVLLRVVGSRSGVADRQAYFRPKERVEGHAKRDKKRDKSTD